MKTNKYLINLKILQIQIFVFVCFVSSINAQVRTYADQVTYHDHVTNYVNAISTSNNFAQLNSYGGIALNIGYYTGKIELTFPNTIPANTTTYIRIDFENDALNSMLAGNLGSLVADLLGTVALGNHYFNIEARTSVSTVYSASSQSPPIDNSLKIVINEFGEYFIAVTPNQDYDRVFIEDVTAALLVGTSNSMNIYYAYYYSEINCATNPLYTSYNGEGLSLEMLGIGGAGVNQPEHAIDNNPATYSELSLGTVNVGAYIEQFIYFPLVYSPSGQVSLSLRVTPALANIGVADNIFIYAYNGLNLVYSENISNAVDIDLLNQLATGEIVTFTITPGASFDRISVRLSAMLDVDIDQQLWLYGIELSEVSSPTSSELVQTFCSGDLPTIEDLQTNESNIIWYDSNSQQQTLDPSLPLENQTIYYGALIDNGCIGSSMLSIEVILEETAAPISSSPEQFFCEDNNPLISDIDISGVDNWYDSLGNELLPDDLLINGNTYYASATEDGCQSFFTEVTITLNTEGNPVINNCPTDTITSFQMEDCGALVTWEPVNVSGNCGTVTLNQSHESGDYFPLGHTTIIYTVEDGVGNTATCSFIVDISDLEAPIISNIPLTQIHGCSGQSVSWEEPVASDNCELISLVSNYQPGDIFPNGTTTVTYTAEDASGNTTSVSFEVSVDEFENIQIENQEYTACSGSDIYASVVNYNPSSNYTWYFNNEQVSTSHELTLENVTEEMSGTYQVVASYSENCQSEAEISVQVNFCGIVIPNGFTPNEDGVNDNFVIENIEAYPNTQITFFNRWGNSVFQSEDYNNDWNGLSQSPMNVGGNKLPEGTYYYILELGGDPKDESFGKTFKGYVYLKRE